MNCIELKGLTKSYRRFEKEPGFRGSLKSLFRRSYISKTAVNSLDLTIDQGEFVGVIGRNGAGKTTLIKMLTGIIPPTAGDISVLGYYPNKLEHAFKTKYAVVMGQKSQLFFDLTPADTFLLFKELYAIPEEEYQSNLEYFIELFDVRDYLNVQVRTLSLGERMKMELIAALLHNPKILFLDEPTIGLDAVAQKQIRSFLRQVNQQKGTTIMLTSHYMEDIKSLCPRSLVIEQGQKVYDGDTAALFERFQKVKIITAVFADQVPAELPDYCKLKTQNENKLVISTPVAEAQKFVKWLFANYQINDVSIEEEETGTIVERIYREGVNL